MPHVDHRTDEPGRDWRSADPDRCGASDEWLFLTLSAQERDAASRDPSYNPRWRQTPARGSDVVSWPVGDVVAVLSSDCIAGFAQSASALLAEFTHSGPAVIVLVPWKEAPTLGRRDDGRVLSFICAGSVLVELLASADGLQLDSLCFHLLDTLLNNAIRVRRLCVRQLGRCGSPCAPAPLTERTSLIMAHRGSRSYLETALEYIDNVAFASMLTVRVGLDMSPCDDYVPLATGLSARELFVVDDPPVGPYVIRQQLIDRCSDPLLLFQDSDDVSCYDRLTHEYAVMRQYHVDLVGCQEIEVDEINHRVEAYRFPLDVTYALTQTGSADSSHKEEEPLLHATAMMRHQAFVDAGGLSTDQRIANDTQFMLRAYFSMKMRNSEEFLYVRRRHPSALTVDVPTAAGCELRRSLAAAWSADFERLKREGGEVANTSLRPRASRRLHALRRLEGTTGRPTESSDAHVTVSDAVGQL